jgi:dihydroneopterin aldolase
MDRIELTGVRAAGHHGLTAAERQATQPFVVDVTCEADLARAASTEELADTVDYDALARTIAHAVAHTSFRLLEALAAHLVEQALAHDVVVAATVRVSKPEAPMRTEVDNVAAVVRREQTAKAGG